MYEPNHRLGKTYFTGSSKTLEKLNSTEPGVPSLLVKLPFGIVPGKTLLRYRFKLKLQLYGASTKWSLPVA